MDTETPDEPDGRTVVDDGVPVSSCAVWGLQRAFHQSRGVDAFGPGGVPEYGTTNPTVACQLLSVLLGFARDAHRAGLLADGRPLHIIELGAGSGRFAHALLRELDRLLPALAPPDLRVVYVLTDLTRAAVDTWRAHPQLQPWLDSGRLDVACFDAIDPDAALTLELSGRTLDVAALAGPTAFIANYFFDALPTDYFHFQAGALHEVVATMTTSSTPPADADAAIKDARVTLAPRLFAAADAPPVRYYGEPAYDALLEHYRQTLQRSVLPLPISGLRLVDRLAALATGPTLWLTTDKGFVAEADLEDRTPPSFEIHGSFSLDTNYHALVTHLTRQHGARALTVTRQARWLQTVAIILGELDTPSTEGAFAEHLERYGPNDYYATLRRLREQLSDGAEGWELEDILAAWRMVRCDWTLLDFAYDAICARLHKASDAALDELHAITLAAWETCFHVGRRPAAASARFGTLLCRAQRLDDGLRLLQLAHELDPDELPVRYNLGTCLAQLGRFDEALHHLDAAVAARPEATAVSAFRDQVRRAAAAQNSPQSPSE